MGKLYTLNRLRDALLSAILLCALPLMAQQNSRKPFAAGDRHATPAPLKIAKASGETKLAYGVLGFDNSQNQYVNGLVSFPIANGAKFTLVKYFGEGTYDVTAGAYANGYYYAELTKTDLETQQMVPVELLRYDIETGETTSVGPLSGYTSHINDMSYDYSTNTMYAISVRDNAYSVLYKIDLNTAKSTEIGTLDRRFFTLACSYDGQLYAISFDGDFCKIDKETATVEFVGATGFKPTYYQSMEFDHSDETLYWAANLVSGTDQGDCIASVDTTTGEAHQVATVGDYPQLGGLYIPFSASAKGTPAAVSDFSVKADANGSLRADLSWTNPTTTFDGQTLSAITTVKVYREKTLVKTFDNPAPGAAMTYSDVMEGDAKDGTFHTYTVVADNDKGEGAEAKDKVFVGHDKLKPVTNLMLSTSPDQTSQATISWKKPAGGLNGGYIDWATLKYDVVRYPDDRRIATDLDATEFTDNTINTLNTYHYAVIAHNADCESEAVNTESRVLGPAKTLPVDFDFTKGTADGDSWTVEDGNDDGYAWTWTMNSTSTVMGHQPSNTEESDDWLISYYLPFKKDVTYRAELNLHAYSADKLEFALLRNMTSADIAQQLYTLNIKGARDKQTVSFVFKPTADGPFNFAIHALSPMRADWIELYDLSIHEAEGVNLAAISITGDETLTAGEEGTYTVKVENRGANDISNFSVSLNDQDGNELAQKNVAAELKSGESTEVAIAWTPQNADVTAVQGEVTVAGDADESDNKTAPMSIKIREKFNGTLANIGTESKSADSTSPFNFSNQYSAALNIYSADEMGVDKNMDIVKTAWMYDAGWAYSDLNDIPVRVYMANTDRTSAADGWIAEDDLTLVYDGTVNIPQQSTGELPITLTTPFRYEAGKNLAVLTLLNSPQYAYVYFTQHASPLEGNASFEWSSYYARDWFDFTKKGVKNYNNYTASILVYMTEPVADGIASVKLDSTDGASYAVYDLAGHKVAEGVASADGIDASALTRGVYVVKFAKDGKTFTSKIAVNK